MHIWVDADATPAVIKDILFRAAGRRGIAMTLVANRLPRVAPGDLVITADIPPAAQVIERGGHALNPRGELYGAENIREILNLRDFMAELRGAGLASSGPGAFSQADRQAFANQLDRFLAKLGG
jgi:uncharacterized protein YaiI (UPF0178 family)